MNGQYDYNYLLLHVMCFYMCFYTNYSQILYLIVTNISETWEYEYFMSIGPHEELSLYFLFD